MFSDLRTPTAATTRISSPHSTSPLPSMQHRTSTTPSGGGGGGDPLVRTSSLRVRQKQQAQQAVRCLQTPLVDDDPGRSLVLQRLSTVFQSNVFETEGPHDDVLKLLLATCKTLVESVSWHQEQLKEVTKKLEYVTEIDAKVETAAVAARQMNETSKRVTFLWAAQGLGDFTIESEFQTAYQRQQPTQGGQPQYPHPQAVAAANSAATSGAVSPSPAAQRKLNLSAVDERDITTGKSHRAVAPSVAAAAPSGTSAAINASGIGHSVAMASAVEDVLRQSLQTSAMAKQHIDDANEQRDQADVGQRFLAIEDSVETVFRRVLKLQTQMELIERKNDDVVEEQRQANHRLTAAIETFDSFGKEAKETHNRIGREQSIIVRGQQEMRSGQEGLSRQLHLLSEQQRNTNMEVVDLRTTRPSFKDVKGIVTAQNSLAGTSPQQKGGGRSSSSGGGGTDDDTNTPPTLDSVAGDVKALYRLFDIPKSEVKKMFAEAASSSTAAAASSSRSRSPASGSSRGGGGGSQPSAAECLKMVHGGLPFKTILKATEKISDAVKRVSSQQDAMLQRAPAAPPLLGLELSDSEHGTTVVRVFPGLPAHTAGLREGDLVVAVGGTSTPTREAFASATSALAATGKAAGAATGIHVMRKGKLVELRLVL